MKSYMICAIAVAILVLTPARSGAQEAGQVGTLSGGKIVPAGQWAMVLPPLASENGAPVVLVSAPRSKWTVKMPASSASDCDVALAMLRESAAKLRLDAFETEVLSKNKPKAIVAATHRNTVEQDVRSVQFKHGKCEESDGSELFRTPMESQPDIDAPYER